MSVFSVAGHTVKITSVAGMGTCVCLSNWKVAIDMGACPSYAIPMDHVFITHSHLDHISAVPIHAQQRTFLSMSAPVYHVSQGLLPKLEAVMQAYLALDPKRLKYTLRQADVGQETKLPGGVMVRPFGTKHRVESQGYAFWKVVSALKEEYKGLGSNEIREKIKEGVEVKQTVKSLEVVVTGDTTIEGLEENPMCFEAKVLITECTYADSENPPELSKERGHIHLDDIVSRASLFKNRHIILMHFSNKYSEDMVKELVNAKLPESLRDRVHLATVDLSR